MCGVAFRLLVLLVIVAEGCGANSGTRDNPPIVTAPSNLVYATLSLSATVGIPITPDTETVSGSSATFAVSPALPAGLALGAVSGTISGTPSAAAASAKYTITATNSAGSTTATLTIEVLIAKPVNLRYAVPVVNDVLASPMQPNVPTVTGTVTQFSVVPNLPVGLVLDPASGVLSGTPRSASPSTVYTVTAENSSGSVTAQLTISVNASESVLLEQGHGDSILAIRMTSKEVLTEDTNGHWVLWNYASGGIVASGDGAATSNQNEIDLAGELAAVTTAQQVQVYSVGDGHQVFSIPKPSWWKLASDGSYLCGGTSTSLTAWSASGDQEFSLAGDYHSAVAYAAPGQIQLANGPGGASVIETDSFPDGASAVSAQFSGAFYSWFLDGQRFLTHAGNTIRIYSSAAAPQALLTLPSITNLTGQGDWFWATKAGYPSDELDVYAVGGTAPSQIFQFPIASSYIGSGDAIGILQEGTPAMSVVDLSGSVPLRSDFSVPPVAYLTSFAAASGSRWVAGNRHGVLVDGASLASTTRYFGFGAVYDIAGSSNRVAVSTAIGKVFVFDPGTGAQINAIDFAAGKLALSSDGSLLGAAAQALDSDFAPDRTLNLYELPSSAPAQSFPYTYNDGRPSLVDFGISASGTVLGQLLEAVNGTSGTVLYTRTATNVSSGSTIWSDTGAGTPILLSPEGTLIATPTTGDSVASSYATNIYSNGDLAGAAAGTGQGWIDEGHLLVVNYEDSPQGPLPSGSSIVDSTGAVVSTIPLSSMPVIDGCSQSPAIQLVGCPQFPVPSRVYDPRTNSIYSLPSGELLWQVPLQVSGDTGGGAVAGSMVVFEEGHRVIVAVGP